jgi:hypothetical protein
MSLHQILIFYAPLTSRMLPEKFQRYEVAEWFGQPLGLAIMSAVPLVTAKHLTAGALMAFVMFILLLTVQAYFWLRGSSTQPDGSHYISPSVASVTQLLVGFAQVVIMVLVTIMTLLATGQLPT